MAFLLHPSGQALNSGPGFAIRQINGGICACVGKACVYGVVGMCRYSGNRDINVVLSVAISSMLDLAVRCSPLSLSLSGALSANLKTCSLRGPFDDGLLAGDVIHVLCVELVHGGGGGERALKVREIG